jgi:hypothetical protein
MTDDSIQIGDIQGVGIAVGAGASVTLYGDVHYYPIVLQAPLREVFDPLIEDRVRLFGGRADILDRIVRRIQEPDGGYTVITAPAGFGKTALLAALVHATPGAFAYHFFTSLYSGEPLSETFFLRNTVQQIAAWHGRIDQAPTDLDDLRALYQQLINIPGERPRVLVLDGLDEVFTWRLALYLSRRLPHGLHLIATIRNGGQNWATEYQFPPDSSGICRADKARALVAYAENHGRIQELEAACYQMRPSILRAHGTIDTAPACMHLSRCDAGANGDGSRPAIADRVTKCGRINLVKPWRTKSAGAYVYLVR